VFNLVITNIIPSNMQALADGVFNTISQLGNSVSLAIIAASVTAHKTPASDENASNSETLIARYRAVFWTLFASMVVVLPLVEWGYRRLGRWA